MSTSAYDNGRIFNGCDYAQRGCQIVGDVAAFGIASSIKTGFNPNLSAMARSTTLKVTNSFRSLPSGNLLGKGSFLRNHKALQLRRNRQLVRRWRGTDNPLDESSLMSGILESKAARHGIQPTIFNRSIFGKIRHSLNSDKPFSQFVSVTRKPNVAAKFAKNVYEFKVRKVDLSKAWWSFFDEAEDLAANGTKIHDVVKIRE